MPTHQRPLDAADKKMHCEQTGPHQADNLVLTAQLRPRHTGQDFQQA